MNSPTHLKMYIIVSCFLLIIALGILLISLIPFEEISFMPVTAFVLVVVSGLLPLSALWRGSDGGRKYLIGVHILSLFPVGLLFLTRIFISASKSINNLTTIYACIIIGTFYAIYVLLRRDVVQYCQARSTPEVSPSELK